MSDEAGPQNERADPSGKWVTPPPQWVPVGKGGEFVRPHIDRLAQAQTSEVMKIAAEQIGLITGFYTLALAQADASFKWALVAAAIGVALFLGAIVFLLTAQIESIAVISVIGGGIVEVIAGINFVLYGKTRAQLADFHETLDQTQRFLLANSICESLEDDIKQKVRAELVAAIATPGIGQPGGSRVDATEQKQVGFD